MECLNNCPCFDNCPNGCLGCDAVECGGSQDPCADPESDPNLGLCEDEAEYRYSKCITKCAHGDYECFQDCGRVYDQELEKCPCRPGCPNGCPCPEFQCESPTTTPIFSETTTTPDYTTTNPDFGSVLIVNSKNTNLPLLTVSGSINFIYLTFLTIYLTL